MIIKSLLDTDLYKLTMGQIIWELYPKSKVKYKFYNRGSQKFSEEFLITLSNEIQDLSSLRFEDDEIDYLRSLGFFNDYYLVFLSTYQFKPNQVICNLTDDDNLEITISGPWYDTIFWEVPLLALISEIYFQPYYTNYDQFNLVTRDKAHKLQENKIKFSDFGTRRRRNFLTQRLCIKMFQYYSNFLGTSNLFFAKQYNVSPIGTVAHEFIMGICGLTWNIYKANDQSLMQWIEYYKGKLGIALTDTYTTEVFLQTFNWKYAKLYDGVRQDSGNPFQFIDKIVDHYKKLNINPMTKTIVFSDNLNVDTAKSIQDYCEYKKISCIFGIGTHFTNDFPEPPLNMVIKLDEIEEKKVIKLSDDLNKATGDLDQLLKIKGEIDADF